MRGLVRVGMACAIVVSLALCGGAVVEAAAETTSPVVVLAPDSGPTTATLKAARATSINATASSTVPTRPSPPDFSGGADKAAFQSGNQAYRQQDYPAAAGWYQALIEEGVRSPELFYNRGNTAAQLGDTGGAVLNYSRALELTPRDEDIRANLSRVVPAGEPLEPPDALGRAGRWVRHGTVGEWLALFGVFYVGAALAGAAWLLRHGTKLAVWLRGAFAVMGVMAMLLALPAGARMYQQRGVRHVVVMETRVPVHSGPDDGFPQIGHAVEGSRLRRLPFAADPDWVRVELPNGLRGFLRADKAAALGVAKTQP